MRREAGESLDGTSGWQRRGSAGPPFTPSVMRGLTMISRPIPLPRACTLNRRTDGDSVSPECVHCYSCGILSFWLWHLRLSPTPGREVVGLGVAARGGAGPTGSPDAAPFYLSG